MAERLKPKEKSIGQKILRKEELEELISTIPQKMVNYKQIPRYEGNDGGNYNHPMFSSTYYFIREHKQFPFEYNFHWHYNLITIIQDLKINYPDIKCIFNRSSEGNIERTYFISFELKEKLYIDIEYYLYKTKEPETCFSCVVYDVSLNDEVENIKNIYKKHREVKNTVTADVGIVTANNIGFIVRNFNIMKNIGPFTNLDLHYGNGFEQYYKDLKNLIKNNTKGLVIFHGFPGTGKTYCIKNLIKDLSQDDKRFLYVSADMVVNIMRPDFITFIMDYAQEDDKKNLISIIEDAEPLLHSRDNGGGDGVSNILNLSDGILNDMLGFQVIATFNTEHKLDSALLRSGRLLSKKEFSKIPVDRAKKLIDVLGIDMPVTKQITLSDIYSFKNTFEVLRHETDEIEEENNKYML